MNCFEQIKRISFRTLNISVDHIIYVVIEAQSFYQFIPLFLMTNEKAKGQSTIITSATTFNANGNVLKSTESNLVVDLSTWSR